MRRYLQRQLARAFRWLQPKLDPNTEALLQTQTRMLNEAAQREAHLRSDYVERASELLEARQMAGAGPWLVHESRAEINKPGPFKFREALDSVGASGDLDLMLSNVEWRREVNLSWLEFSRWGIQQIILISRLYYIKNPLIQRGVNCAAIYVFGRGVEISSPDEAANQVLTEFLERNKSTLGQIALVDLERRKYYDGNLFFCFFSDVLDSGQVTIRTIDAVEIMDIVTDPDDTDKPWFYRRVWTERTFNEQTGFIGTQTREAWYPALNYEPAGRVSEINGYPVMWDNPVLHRRCGSVSKWLFGCPLVYAALDWAKAAKKFLEACATVKASLAQIAMTLTTKGGQQALEGMKQQLQTNVNTGTGIWDTNPPAIAGSIFGSGPDTVLKAFNTQGAGGDPGEVREYRNFVACVLGIPPTFLGDLETSNLATATTLDRPTELNFLEKQEAWREDLMTICHKALRVSQGAASGRLREAGRSEFKIVEAKRERVDGRLIETKKQDVKAGEIIISVNFPAILEGDLPATIAAVCAADATGKLDEKTVAMQLYDLLPGVENGAEIADEQYPGTVAERQKEKDDAAAVALAKPVKPTEALTRRLAKRLIESVEAEKVNGSGHAH